MIKISVQKLVTSFLILLNVSWAQGLGTKAIIVDKFPCPTFKNAQVNDIFKVAEEQLYAVGSCDKKSGAPNPGRWAMWESKDRGRSWQLRREAFKTSQGEVPIGTAVSGQMISASQKIVVSGRFSKGAQDYAVVLISSDKGKTWQIVEEVKYKSLAILQGIEIIEAPLGKTILFGCFGCNSEAQDHSLSAKIMGSSGAIQRLFNFSKTTPIQGIRYEELNLFFGNLVVSKNGTFFLSAKGYRKSKAPHSNWILLRSTNNGESWQLVDNFIHNHLIESLSEVRTIGNSTIVALGRGIDQQNNDRISWITRVSYDNAETWKMSVVEGDKLGSINFLKVKSDGQLVAGADLTYSQGPRIRDWKISVSSDMGATWEEKHHFTYRDSAYSEIRSMHIFGDEIFSLGVAGNSSWTLKDVLSIFRL